MDKSLEDLKIAAAKEHEGCLLIFSKLIIY